MGFSNNILSSLKNFFRQVYEKLAGIQDSPHKIALGFGLGVFLGILPGVGPVASLVLAALFRVNKAAAVVGSFLTNTWISLIGFILAVKIGAWVTNHDWRQMAETYKELLKSFNGQELFQISFLKMIYPLVIGYFIFSFLCGMAAFVIVLFLLKLRNRRVKS